jgi:hypothetical protein
MAPQNPKTSIFYPNCKFRLNSRHSCFAECISVDCEIARTMTGGFWAGTRTTELLGHNLAFLGGMVMGPVCI